MSEVPIEGRIIEPNTTTIYWVPEGMNPEAPTAADLAGATKLEGVTVIEPSIDNGSDWDTPVRTATNYSAQMSFTRETPGTFTEEMNSLWRSIAPGQWQSQVLGRWEYTPREELKDRLNNWLQGTYPGEPINWKGLS